MSKLNIGQTILTTGEIEAALAVLRSGVLRQGEICSEFEEAYAAKVGSSCAITCSSGSAALHLAYMSFLEPGDEVLVPSFTFFATGSMVNAAGGKPVFCDVDCESFLIDLDDAERNITERTRAISPVHLFGNPCNVDAVQTLASKYNLQVVWDAAQAHGASYHGKDIGALDDFVCYSFYPSKNMFVGEGGMICTNSDEQAGRLRALREHGQTGKYFHTMLGLNYRMTEVEAAIGLEQLKRFDEMLCTRRRNAELLTQGLSNTAGLKTPSVTSGGEHAWHQYSILIEEEEFGCSRDTFVGILRENDIGTAIHYPRGMHQQPIYEQLYGRVFLPVTEELCGKIVALPVHQGVTENDLAYIVEIINQMHNT